MPDLWGQGLWQFELGNFYGAREFWEHGLAESEPGTERVQFLNALVPVYYRLRGPEQALEFSETAARLASVEPIDPGLRMKCLANLAQVLCQSDKIEEALRVGRSTLQFASLQRPLESVFVYEAYIYTLMQAELYRDVLRLVPECMRYAEALSESQGKGYHTALFCHYFGYSAQVLHEYDVALNYYLQAADAFRRPETVMDLCRAFLFLGKVDEAIRLAGELHAVLWDFPDFNEKLQLGYGLVVIGTMAHFGDRAGLAERCFEKAELYFGQLSKWNEWVNLRDWRRVLDEQGARERRLDADWSLWSAFVDDLNLMDGLELMFPQAFRMSRIATDIAYRIAKALLGDDATALRDLQVAGRLVYLGFTVLYPDEARVFAALVARDARAAAIQHGLRLLEVYPHSDGYCQILTACVSHTRGQSEHSRLDGQVQVVADCLAVAIEYVEQMDLRNTTHRDAMVACMGRLEGRIAKNVMDVFCKFMTPSDYSQVV